MRAAPPASVLLEIRRRDRERAASVRSFSGRIVAQLLGRCFLRDRRTLTMNTGGIWAAPNRTSSAKAGESLQA